PPVFFSRPIDVHTLTSGNFYLSASGARLPSTIVPSGDGTFAWLFPAAAMPGGSIVSVTMDGATIRAADGTVLDADSDGAPGGIFSFHFSTVPLTTIANTRLCGTIADPGPDLRPNTQDD